MTKPRGRSPSAVDGRGDVALGDAKAERRRRRRLAGRADDRPIGGPPDDRVAAFERPLRIEDGEGGGGGVEIGAGAADAGGGQLRERGGGAVEGHPAPPERPVDRPHASIEQQPDPFARRRELGERVEPVEGAPLRLEVAPPRAEVGGGR